MDEAEALKIMAVPKWGEPSLEWRHDTSNLQVNLFGVVDHEGKTIPGLLVDFSVNHGARLKFKRYVFTLFKKEFGSHIRVYQQEINLRPGVARDAHQYSHEHIGIARYVADEIWAMADFDNAVERFCKTIFPITMNLG